MNRLLLLFVLPFVLNACAGEADDSICRPSDIPPKVVQIGDWMLAEGDIVRVHVEEAYNHTFNVEGTLSEEACAHFRELTTENIGKKLPIRIDGETIVSPVIRSPISACDFSLGLGYSQSEATSIALAMAPACGAED